MSKYDTMLDVPKQPDADAKCPVCEDFKWSWEQICRECQEYKDHVTARRRARARRREFGEP